ncbi:helix-turn-helix domain-containing protein [Streptomyces sp. NRRL F-5135]|uniref:helix-turn-helix domain-containing protein n=1 Tax=Streptomyces sp. NRRL F-5135 TaxID=1463858 RepID=UPI00099C8D24|nr:helix-turn-helix transcriptional regulator [Streptomyces sp. NRRL F-5135]
MRAHYQDPGAVRRRRIAAGLTQQALADRAGLSKGHVSGIERGLAGASAPALGRLATALACEVEDLMAPVPAAATR